MREGGGFYIKCGDNSLKGDIFFQSCRIECQRSLLITHYKIKCLRFVGVFFFYSEIGHEDISNVGFQWLSLSSDIKS